MSVHKFYAKFGGSELYFKGNQIVTVALLILVNFPGQNTI